MNCRQVDEHIFSYCDGELAPSLSSELASHIAGCPACQSQLELTRLENELLASELTCPALPESFAAGVMAAISRNIGTGPMEMAAAKNRKPWYTRTPLWLTATAAAFILLLYTVSPAIFSPSKDIAEQKAPAVKVADINPASNFTMSGRAESKAAQNSKKEAAANESIAEEQAKVMTVPADTATEEADNQVRTLATGGSGDAGGNIYMKRDSYPDRDRSDTIKLKLPANVTFGGSAAPRISNMPTAYHMVNTANQSDTWTYFYEGNGQQIIISLNTNPSARITNYAAPAAPESPATAACGAAESNVVGNSEAGLNSVCRSLEVDNVNYQLTVSGELSQDDLSTLASQLTVEK